MWYYLFLVLFFIGLKFNTNIMENAFWFIPIYIYIFIQSCYLYFPEFLKLYVFSISILAIIVSYYTYESQNSYFDNFVFFIAIFISLLSLPLMGLIIVLGDYIIYIQYLITIIVLIWSLFLAMLMFGMGNGHYKK